MITDPKLDELEKRIAKAKAKAASARDALQQTKEMREWHNAYKTLKQHQQTQQQKIGPTQVATRRINLDHRDKHTNPTETERTRHHAQSSGQSID